MFVSVEGIEASGKSTVVNEVARRLRQDRWSVDLLREFAPSHSRAPVEDAVRKSIFFSLGFEEGPRAALLYMLYHEAVKWDRATGLSRDVMLADRFLDSIVAYQGQFLPADISIDTAMLEEQIAGLMRQIGIPIPDQTYLLDVSPELCAERFARREGRPLTDFELAQITQIRASFLALARSNSRIMVVDASDALESVVDLISEDLRWRLEGRRRDHPGNGLLLPRPPLRWANSEQSSATGASRQRLESGGVVPSTDP